MAIRAHILLLIGLAFLACPAVFAVDTGSYRLEISKSARELRVMQGDQVIRRFHAAIGKGGLGTKRRLGDNKTPDGHYRIVNFRADSRFHFFMQLDYPNLLDAWHGYRNELINAGEFRAIATAYHSGAAPPQETALGGYIGIHGIGELTDRKLDIHASNNWTEGCIALTNEEINELLAYVAMGTRVVIRE
ncbi:MAG: L,D-transpeptidase [Gammaproteobacteria bacterium]|nr:L,D-transpeptidase [Gammaproteobacteria bacterium]